MDKNAKTATEDEKIAWYARDRGWDLFYICEKYDELHPPPVTAEDVLEECEGCWLRNEWGDSVLPYYNALRKNAHNRAAFSENRFAVNEVSQIAWRNAAIQLANEVAKLRNAK